jgi:hypothetical protein
MFIDPKNLKPCQCLAMDGRRPKRVQKSSRPLQAPKSNLLKDKDIGKDLDFFLDKNAKYRYMTIVTFR